jgi:hypothetical protein
MTSYYRQNRGCVGSFFNTRRTNELQREVNSLVNQHQSNLNLGLTGAAKIKRVNVITWLDRFGSSTIEHAILQKAYVAMEVQQDRYDRNHVRTVPSYYTSYDPGLSARDTVLVYCAVFAFVGLVSIASAIAES